MWRNVVVYVLMPSAHCDLISLFSYEDSDIICLGHTCKRQSACSLPDLLWAILSFSFLYTCLYTYYAFSFIYTCSYTYYVFCGTIDRGSWIAWSPPSASSSIRSFVFLMRTKACIRIQKEKYLSQLWHHLLSSCATVTSISVTKQILCLIVYCLQHMLASYPWIMGLSFV